MARPPYHAGATVPDSRARAVAVVPPHSRLSPPGVQRPSARRRGPCCQLPLEVVAVTGPSGAQAGQPGAEQELAQPPPPSTRGPAEVPCCSRRGLRPFPFLSAAVPIPAAAPEGSRRCCPCRGRRGVRRPEETPLLQVVSCWGWAGFSLG